MTESFQCPVHFTVVVPTCARNAELSRCLARLAPGRQAGMALVPLGANFIAGVYEPTYEVIVTDDGSTSTAEALLREHFAWAKWVRGPRKGPAANRNHGARHAHGLWLVFTDDDCLPDVHWLGTLATAAAPGDRVLEGRTCALGEQPHPLAQCPINETGGRLWSCNFAILRSLFEQVGGFDERFPYATVEDIEFALRLGHAGAKVRFVPGALIHHPWKDIRFLDLRRRQIKSQLLLRELYPEQKRWISLAMHGKRVVRFYLKELPAGLRQFGWRQVRFLPVQMCDHLLTAVMLVTHRSQTRRAPMAGGRPEVARAAVKINP